jgi:hypothetical protein
MPKIDTFEKYVKAYEEADYDFDAITLSSTEQEAVKNSILTFGDEPIKNALAVLDDYYAMKVPTSIIKEILSEDFELAYEAYSDGIRDTCQRELIIDAVLKHIGMRRWPMNGEGREVMNEFIKQLKVKAKAANIEFSIDIDKLIK